MLRHCSPRNCVIMVPTIIEIKSFSGYTRMKYPATDESNVTRKFTHCYVLSVGAYNLLSQILEWSEIFSFICKLIYTCFMYLSATKIF